MEKVKLVSTVNHPVGITVPALNFNREWLNKGSSVSVDKEVLAELMYDSGVKYMLETGMIYIEDMEVKKELGLEPEDATEPVNVIVLSDDDMKLYWTLMSLQGFKEKIATLNYEQISALADYAIEHHMTNYDKCQAVKECCGRDIIRAIQLDEANKEA